MHVCDFCGKDQTEVKRMITAKSVDICEECVLLCMDILVKETKQDFKEIKFQNESKQNGVN